MGIPLNYKEKLHNLQGRKILYEEQLIAAKEEQIKLEHRQQSIELAQVFVQAVAQKTQEQLKLHIEDIVNLCLKTCFGDLYEFQLNYVTRRNRTEADIGLSSNGVFLDPSTSVGGGVCDILSLGLRMAAWSLGKTQNVICLDESLKYLSADLQSKGGEILQEIVKKLQIQLLFVTHSAILLEYADRIYSVKLIKGKSQILLDKS